VRTLDVQTNQATFPAGGAGTMEIRGFEAGKLVARYRMQV